MIPKTPTKAAKVAATAPAHDTPTKAAPRTTTTTFSDKNTTAFATQDGSMTPSTEQCSRAEVTKRSVPEAGPGFDLNSKLGMQRPRSPAVSIGKLSFVISYPPSNARDILSSKDWIWSIAISAPGVGTTHYQFNANIHSAEGAVLKSKLGFACGDIVLIEEICTPDVFSLIELLGRIRKAGATVAWQQMTLGPNDVSSSTATEGSSIEPDDMAFGSYALMVMDEEEDMALFPGVNLPVPENTVARDLHGSGGTVANVSANVARSAAVPFHEVKAICSSIHIRHSRRFTGRRSAHTRPLPRRHFDIPDGHVHWGLGYLVPEFEREKWLARPIVEASRPWLWEPTPEPRDHGEDVFDNFTYLRAAELQRVVINGYQDRHDVDIQQKRSAATVDVNTSNNTSINATELDEGYGSQGASAAATPNPPPDSTSAPPAKKRKTTSTTATKNKKKCTTCKPPKPVTVPAPALAPAPAPASHEADILAAYDPEDPVNRIEPISNASYHFVNLAFGTMTLSTGRATTLLPTAFPAAANGNRQQRHLFPDIAARMAGRLIVERMMRAAERGAAEEEGEGGREWDVGRGTFEEVLERLEMEEEGQG